MTIYTIQQKMSGTGYIRSIASAEFGRDILFPLGSKYAVVLASPYKGYSTYTTAEAAITASRKCGCRHEVIDSKGNKYDIRDDYFGGKLVRL